MNSIQDQLKARFDKSQQRIQQVLDEHDILGKVDAYKEKTKETIKKYPIPSLLAGLAIGFLVGKVFSASNDNE